MNPKFLSPIPLTLNAPHGDCEACGITRRSFMKRAGGATMAAFIAWNVNVQNTHAQSLQNNSSCDCVVQGIPCNAASGYTDGRQLDFNGWSFKVKQFTTPYDGNGKFVTVSTKGAAWSFWSDSDIDDAALDDTEMEYYTDEPEMILPAETTVLALNGVVSGKCNFTAQTDPTDIRKTFVGSLRSRSYARRVIAGQIPIAGTGNVSHQLILDNIEILDEAGEDKVTIAGDCYIVINKTWTPEGAYSQSHASTKTSEKATFLMSVERVINSCEQ